MPNTNGIYDVEPIWEANHTGEPTAAEEDLLMLFDLRDPLQQDFVLAFLRWGNGGEISLADPVEAAMRRVYPNWDQLPERFQGQVRQIAEALVATCVAAKN